MEESVLLGTKPLVDSIRHFIREPLTREILFLPLEHKIHIFSPPCNILYICSRKFGMTVGSCSDFGVTALDTKFRNHCVFG